MGRVLGVAGVAAANGSRRGGARMPDGRMLGAAPKRGMAASDASNRGRESSRDTMRSRQRASGPGGCQAAAPATLPLRASARVGVIAAGRGATLKGVASSPPSVTWTPGSRRRER
ncbi:MAG: hypothetical protein ACYC97_06625 [Metallibacterium sp.]